MEFCRFFAILLRLNHFLDRNTMVRTLFAIVAASALLAGCSSSSRLSRLSPPPAMSKLSVGAAPTLKQEIDQLLADSLFPPSNVGIKVISLATREVLYSLNERALFNPASNQKLFTASTALLTLGPTYAFSSMVYADTLTHTLLVKGFGDPLLSTEDLDSLARVIAPQCSDARPWRLAVDPTFFDDLSWGEGWTWDEEPAAYGMFISPLMLNNNAITVQVQPGPQQGDPAIVTTDPPTSYISFECTATTGPDTGASDLTVTRKWRERSNTISVTGTVRKGSRPTTQRLSVWKPELYAGTVLAERLQKYGMKIHGVGLDTVRSTARELARFQHAIDTVVTFFNKESDNLSGEALLKTMGALRYGGPGTARNGIRVVDSLLSRWGIDTNSVSIVDGSGLSRYDLTSVSTIITLLDHMYREPAVFKTFIHSLPIAGVDGTIGSRMRSTPAQGNVRAKTGTLSGVTALSGYVRSGENEPLAFSILMQNFTGGARRYREVQDRIGILLSQFSRADNAR
jgi:serine-type D-Ala-D-Ala carboxypeptidase/endopeptidase (penicillin-binding protein 4)